MKRKQKQSTYDFDQPTLNPQYRNNILNPINLFITCYPLIHMKVIYLIGALRNQTIVELGNKLRAKGFDVFDEWINPGPEADEFWQKYEAKRGRTYKQALNSYHAKHVFEFDKTHLDRADIVVLVMPAGKSAHLELGYAVGMGKKAYLLFEKEPERYDLMYRF